MSDTTTWAEEAAFFQAHKDDPEDTSESEAPPTGPRPVESQGLSVTVTVRFSPHDAAALRETARVLKRSYSEIIREAVRQYARPAIHITPTTTTIEVNQTIGTRTELRHRPAPSLPFDQSSNTSNRTLAGQSSAAD